MAINLGTTSSQSIQRFDKLVNPDGTPTEYFLKVLQLRENLLTDFQGAVDAILQELDSTKANSSTQIIAGDELSGGGDLSADRTIDHDEKFPGGAGTYGDATHVPQFTVNEFGHITDVDEVPISGGGGGGGLYDISMGVPLLSALTSVGATYATFTENAGKGINVRNSSSVGGNSTLLGWTKPKPAATFHVAVLMLHQLNRQNYYRPQIGVYNSGNGRFETMGANIDDSTAGQNELATWTAYNARTGTSAINGPYSHGPFWMHVKYDGTNIKYGYSVDGANPYWAFTRTLADFVGAITDIYFGIFAFDASTLRNPNLTVLCYDENADARVMGV